MSGGLCLVTGGAGFIGSHIVDALLARGHRVRVYDSLVSGSLENLSQTGDRTEFINGDVRDLGALLGAMSSIDFVFHEAAVPSIPWSVDRPAENHEVNATGTLNVLIAAREAGVRRVIYASSCSVYGDTDRLPLDEDLPSRCGSPYSAAKLMGEYYCQVFTRVYGVPTVALRYFNVFGPRQHPNSQYGAAIPTFIARLEAGEAPVVFGDGLQSRDFIAVDNVVHANLLAAIAAAILLEDGPPVFFRRDVAGLGGRAFRLVKFRTMTNGDHPAADLDPKGDLRLTWVGRIVRPTALDELPSLWHILRGDMSFVGPRTLLTRVQDPADPDYGRDTASLPNASVRYSVRPGLTGLAQIRAGKSLSYRRKFRLDAIYVRRMSLCLDLQLLGASFVKAFRRRWR